MPIRTPARRRCHTMKCHLYDALHMAHVSSLPPRLNVGHPVRRKSLLAVASFADGLVDGGLVYALLAIHHYYPRVASSSQARPLGVSRYFWRRLVGLSGMVRSGQPAV